jgi:hypothetical protein
MKRTVVNRLIRQAMSRRARLVKRAKARLLGATPVATAGPSPRGGEGLERFF